jgi:PAS domain S-box-containing protein
VDPEPLDTFPERFSACVAPEDRQQWSDSVENAVAAVCLWEGEARFLKPTGEEMYVRGISQPERGGGQIVFSGVLQDVTERKRLDLALAQSERRYRKLHESVRDAFVSVDMTGLIQDFNAIFRQMLGYSDEELRQQTYLDLTPERWHTFEAGIVRDQVLARGYSEVYEKEYRRKDGTVFPVELRAYLIRDESDRPVAMWAIVRDVTERKRTEAALREFSARLIRTQEEERARLARELHDDITQRLAHLAIEIGRAMEVAPAASWAEARRSVREELIRLSEDVHALSYRLHPSILEDLGLAAAVQAEAEHLERQGPVPIEVKVHNLPDPISSEVAVCAFRIAQEALRNAVRHAHARTLTVSLFGSDGGVQLGVQDDGCGFDTGQQRHRFSLGLASMRERAHLLGGELDVDSAPGQGTTITVWIPLQQTPRAEG